MSDPSNPYDPPQTEPGPDPASLLPDKDARMWGMLAHISALCMYVGVPGFVGPLIIWLLKKKDHPFVDDQGKESLNFQISIAIYAIVSGILVCAFVGFFLLAAVAVFDVVFVIIAAIKANAGETYRYPLTIRLIN